MSSIKLSVVTEMFWKFLEGPGPHSPVLEMSMTSILYFLRDVTWFLLAVIPSFLVVLLERIFPRQEKDVKDQVVLITGASAGIGKELALSFAKLGSKVVCVNLNKQRNDEIVKMLQETTGNMTNYAGYVCDVADSEDIKLLAEKVHKRFGHVDILLHNAGILGGASILGPEDKFVRRIIDVNLLSTFWLIRSFLPRMIERKQGHIVINSSYFAMTPVGNATVYTTTKAGQAGLLNSLSRELRTNPDTRNIKLSSVHPWWVNTHPEFVKYVKGRLKPDHGAMSAQEAARQIVVGIRREYETFCVPGIRTTFTILSLMKLLPSNLYHMLKDIEGCFILVPEGQPYVPPPSENFIL